MLPQKLYFCGQVKLRDHILGQTTPNGFAVDLSTASCGFVCSKLHLTDLLWICLQQVVDKSTTCCRQVVDKL